MKSRNLVKVLTSHSGPGASLKLKVLIFQHAILNAKYIASVDAVCGQRYHCDLQKKMKLF